MSVLVYFSEKNKKKMFEGYVRKILWKNLQKKNHLFRNFD